MRFSTILRKSPIHLQSSIKLLHSLPRPKPNRFFRKPKLVKTQTQSPKAPYTRDTVSNIYNLLKYSTWDSALSHLPNLPIKWDSHVINRVLKSHPPMQKAWLFFNWAASDIKGFKHDHFTYTTMLDIFGEAGRIQSMYSVFHLMKEKGVAVDAVTYTSMIHWVGDVDEAVRLWKEMRGSGCEPTVVSYTAYMKVLFDGGRVEEATEVYREMLRERVSPNCYTYTVLMEFLVGAGKCEEALDIFFRMQEIGVEPDKAACNILIGKACKFGETSFMARILVYMKENGVVLRYPVFLEALETLKAAGQSVDLLKEVNSHINVESLCSNDIVEVELDDMESSDDSRIISSVLLMKQSLVAVDHLLNQMKDRDMKLDSFVVSAIVETNCGRCRAEGASLALGYSSEMGIHLEKSAYLALVGCFMRENELRKVVEAVREMVKAHHSLGVYRGATLIHRLGFGRRPRLAAEVFDLLPDDQKGVAAYTALMDVYMSAGSPEKAMKIFEEMRGREIVPSVGTYDVLLSGLEKTSDFQREVGLLKKEKKSLVATGRFREDVDVEEKVCDLLFARNL